MGGRLNKSIKNRQIYVYSSSHLTPTERVKFFYALKGRNGKPGILDTTQSVFFAKSVLSVLPAQFEEIEQFLKEWNCKFYIKKIKSSNKPTHALIRYSTTHMNSTERVKFVYAVHGRGSSEGFLRDKEILAKTALFVSIKKLAEIKKFFGSWNCELLIEEVEASE
ncbi:hypothetical protein HOH11_03100 [Candidatus Woesearchaeota archaeon]|nr:hypothetical protein [Candidatus Woesearchaeota archaeon]MBT6023558.1 hypothetical protein [Candidatus Woesearchaeota archaeon]